MIEGLMQHEYPLTMQHFLYRMRRCAPEREVVSVTPAGTTRASYREVAERVDRLAGALVDLGIEPGDRVGTLAWNSQRHFELYLAVPCVGAVLHTINLRFSPEQLAYVINHAQDRVLFVDGSLADVLAEVLPLLTTVRHVVVMPDTPSDALPSAHDYEELLTRASPGFAYPQLDPRQAAGLCYTTGTTGNPKGVLYSHLSNVLHALSACTADCLGISSADRVLLIVPMFHANGWGLPYAAALAGADLILPGRVIDAPSIARLIEQERATISGSVPTIWMDLLRYADRHAPDLSSIRVLTCGGSAAPLSLMKGFEDRHGIKLIELWGMTETSPLCTVAWPPSNVERDSAEYWHHRDTAGRLLPFVEARILDEAGHELPWDGEATGELQVRGPWIASSYFEDSSSSEKFDGQWLRTGDVAWIDRQAYMKVTDRAKDVIKSGGEWISSIELEAQLLTHPDVVEAAVIAMPHDKWAERPLACVVLAAGSSCDGAALRDHLSSRLPRWWLPDAFAFVDAIPKTSVGKLDKKVLRQRLQVGTLDGLVALAEAKA